jgi:DtxR family transcriptional regulator, Mn-dependent transcriptional regulator
MDEKSLAPLSESVQMYLVTIARLRVDSRPVSLSQLAQSLSISPVSVNEMCRKLQDQGLLIYQPYKGASLTPEGEQQAYYILRRHRLWEVFLVEKLGFAYDQAHDAACQLEHCTPNQLADRLDVFLGYPSVNPKGEPIPRTNGSLPARILVPLAAFSAAQRARVVHCDVSEAAQTFLDERGVRPGASVTVMATAEDSLLVQVGEAHISLARAVAEAIQMEPEEEKGGVTPLESITKKGELEMEPKTEATVTQIPLHELSVGQRGIVVHVGGQGPARRRMMDMGLVPGSEVKVVRVAPLGDPVEFEVKGYSLSLRKSEARDITVEVPVEEAG